MAWYFKPVQLIQMFNLIIAASQPHHADFIWIKSVYII